MFKGVELSTGVRSESKASTLLKEKMGVNGGSSNGKTPELSQFSPHSNAGKMKSKSTMRPSKIGGPQIMTDASRLKGSMSRNTFD